MADHFQSLPIRIELRQSSASKHESITIPPDFNYKHATRYQNKYPPPSGWKITPHPCSNTRECLPRVYAVKRRIQISSVSNIGATRTPRASEIETRGRPETPHKATAPGTTRESKTRKFRLFEIKTRRGKIIIQNPSKTVSHIANIARPRKPGRFAGDHAEYTLRANYFYRRR